VLLKGIGHFGLNVALGVTAALFSASAAGGCHESSGAARRQVIALNDVSRIADAWFRVKVVMMPFFLFSDSADDEKSSEDKHDGLHFG